MPLWGKKDTSAVTGTIAVTNGSADVVGTSTAFTTELKAGSFIVVGGVKYKVLKITDNTNLTLTSNFEASTASGLTITTQLAPTYLSVADARNAVFVSAEEAVLKTNKDKGILGAGWWLVKEYKDSDGKSRYKSQLLVAMTAANATSGDAADDTVVADAEVTITISAQPANQTSASGAATFSVTASATSGSVTYQWQKRASVTARWANVTNATNSTLVLSGQVLADSGSQYRVVLSSTSGAVKVNSDAATLTFGT